MGLGKFTNWNFQIWSVQIEVFQLYKLKFEIEHLTIWKSPAPLNIPTPTHKTWLLGKNRVGKASCGRNKSMIHESYPVAETYL